MDALCSSDRGDNNNRHVMERTAAGRQMPALDLFGGTLRAENVVVANATNHRIRVY